MLAVPTESLFITLAPSDYVRNVAVTVHQTVVSISEQILDPLDLSGADYQLNIPSNNLLVTD